jgi:hypothetical protein
VLFDEFILLKFKVGANFFNVIYLLSNKIEKLEGEKSKMVLYNCSKISTKMIENFIIK